MTPIAFLRQLRPSGIHNLVAIDPDTPKVDGISRPLPAGEHDLRAFIDRHTGSRNLYFSVNEPVQSAPDSKLKKEHIATAGWLFVDCDPNKTLDLGAERERLDDQYVDLLQSDHPPTFSIDSGGGYQHFWRVYGDVGNTDTLEGHNRGLIEKFGGDPNAWNIDRIMRLPGTTNYPDKKKRAAGRSTAPATLMHFEPTPLEHNPESIAPFVPIAETIADDISFDYEQAKSFNRPDADYMISGNGDTALWNRWDGDTTGLKDDSRSGLAMSIASHMKRLEFTDQEIANALYHHPKLKGSEWTPRELQRTIARATNPKDPATAFGKLSDDDLRTIEQSERHRPTIQQIINTHNAVEKPHTKLVRIKARDAEPNVSDDYLVEDLLDPNSFTVLYGEPNAGKSFMALHIAFCIASNRLFGAKRVKPGGVMYFAAEAGTGFAKRVKALRVHYNVNDFNLEYCPSPVDLLHKDGDVEAFIQLVTDMKNETGQPVKLLVIDTLARVMSGGNENSPDDMGALIKNLDIIRDRLACSIILVHHSGKDKTLGARGHSSLRGAADTELEVAHAPGGGSVRVMTTKKQREMEHGLPVRFGLPVVDVAVSMEGKTITSCVVAMEDDASSVFTELDGDGEGDMAAPDNTTLCLKNALSAAILYAKEYHGGDGISAPIGLWGACWAGRNEEYKPQFKKIIPKHKVSTFSLVDTLNDDQISTFKRYKTKGGFFELWEKTSPNQYIIKKVDKVDS